MIFSKKLNRATFPYLVEKIRLHSRVGFNQKARKIKNEPLRYKNRLIRVKQEYLLLKQNLWKYRKDDIIKKGECGSSYAQST